MTLKTDEFIKVLARAPQPSPVSLGLVAFALVIAGWGLTYIILGLRPDLAALPDSFLRKTGALALAAVIASLGLQRAARPLALPFPTSAAMIAALAFVVWLAREWTTVPTHDIMASFLLPNFRFCLGFTTIYGLAAMAGLVYALRAYAPADGRKAATCIGLAASFIAGLGYSLHCPIDSPTFILVAYGLPVTMLTLLARGVLPRFLQW